MGRDQQGGFLQPWSQLGVGHLGRFLSRWRCRRLNWAGPLLARNARLIRFIAIQLHAAAAGLYPDLGHKGGDIATAGNQRHQLGLQQLGLA